MLDVNFSENKFYELKEQQYKIQSLMSVFQNPVPITEKDILYFDELKNDIINKINSISMDLKIEYERSK